MQKKGMANRSKTSKIQPININVYAEQLIGERFI